jgi:hypothetical protein
LLMFVFIDLEMSGCAVFRQANVMSRDIADTFGQDITDTSVASPGVDPCPDIGGWCRW